MIKCFTTNWLIIAAWLGGFAVFPAAGKTPVEYANPLVGTASLDDPKLLGNAPPPGEEAYSGFTYPGPALPHRDILLGPINKDLTEAAGNHGIIFPYVHGRRTMMGFSAPMPDLTIMPVVGGWNVPPDRSYASPYDQATETASPGYYSVFFPDSGIHVELTTTERIGYYRFTYPATERGAVLIDLGAGDNAIEITGDHTVRGRGQRGGRCFVAEFSKPFKAFGTFRQNQPQLDGGRVRRDDSTTPDSRAESGSYAGSYLDFSTRAGEPILVRIASARSYEAAQRLLDAETGSFAEVRQRAQSAWSEKLNLIQVKGGTEKERELFYSTLYNSLLFPKLITKKGDPLRGRNPDGRVAEYDRYSPIAFWDTGRNQIVLLTLLEPDVKTNILRTHLEMARESGWMHTSFHGDHAVFMYLPLITRPSMISSAKTPPIRPARAVTSASIWPKAGSMTSLWIIPARRTRMATPASPPPWNIAGMIMRWRNLPKSWAGRRITKCSWPAPIIIRMCSMLPSASCAAGMRMAPGSRHSIRLNPTTIS